MPLVHNTMPFSQTKKSFVEWIKWPYHRLKGFGNVKRNDPVVFNFPEGDTVSLAYPSDSYYNALRQYQRRYGDRRGRQMLMDEGIVVRPVDKRETMSNGRSDCPAIRFLSNTPKCGSTDSRRRIFR